jgi:hypothetical protein
MVLGLQISTAEPAHADNCVYYQSIGGVTYHYQYGGYRLFSSTGHWYGIERYVGLTSPHVPNLPKDHFLAFLGVDTPPGESVPVSWLHMGHAYGKLNQYVVDPQTVYSEYESPDIFGGAVQTRFYGTPGNNFFSIFATGQHDSNGLPYYNAYQGTTIRELNLPLEASTRVMATMEGAILNSEGGSYWPTVDASGASLHFGQPAAGGYPNSNWSIFKTSSSSSPDTWLEWVTPPTQTCDSGPYFIDEIFNYSAFDVYG